VPTAAAAPLIERLEPADLDQLEPLWHALLARHSEVWSRLPMREAHHSWTLRRGQYEGWLAHEGSFVLVARRDDVLMGYLMVDVGEGDETYVTGDRVARLETLVVAENQRDAGVGGLLFDAAMAELERLAVDDLFVGCMDGNEAARRFYERRGFTPFVHHLYAKRPGARLAGKEAP
jgi:ribosomal protein S18 acetylase RimI-like enzyme